MKKQKLLAQVFAISSSLIFALGLASCDDNIHTHEYGEWEITTPPTCETGGIETRTCTKCDASEEQSIDPLGHDYGDWVITTPATCEENGVETRTCSRDSTHIETKDVEKIGHDYGDYAVTKPATCEDEGVETRVCANDETHVEAQDIDALGHDYGEWVITTPATCTTAGVRTKTCSHDETHVISEDIAPLGHDYGEWTVTTPATCEDEGVETRVCSHDETHVETRAVPALGHDYGDWVTTTPATCTTAGVRTKTCSHDATHVISEEISPLGHDYSYDTSSAGIKIYTCSRNDDTHTTYVTPDGTEYIATHTANAKNTSGTITFNAVGDSSKYYVITWTYDDDDDDNPYITKVTATGTTQIVIGSTPAGFTGFDVFKSTAINSTSITDIILTNEVKVGANIFNGCTQLVSINIPTLPNKSYSIASLWGATNANTAKSKVPTTLKSVTISNLDKLTTTQTYALAYLTNVTDIVIKPASGVTALSFASNAFNSTTNLVNLTLPSCISYTTNISLTALTNFYFEGSLSDWIKGTRSTDSNPMSVATNFYYLENGEYKALGSSITIPSDITTIGAYAFAGNKNITSVVIPSTVTSYGTNVFYKCTNLSSVTINSTADIAANMFTQCTSLTSITLPDGVEKIGSGAFQASGLTSISFPSSIVEIASAFENCNSLTSVTIPDGVNLSGTGIFRNNSNLTTVVIGKNVTSIPDQAFYNCTSLSSLTLNEGLTTIGVQAFAGTKITSLTLPTTVTTIGTNAFRLAPITTLSLNEGLTTIGNAAFYGSKLTSVNIPSSVTSIGSYAFAYITTLTSINVDANNSVYVSKDGDLYDKNLTTIYQYAIGKNDTSISLPASVTTIGSGAYDTASFASIVIPSTITTIGYYAFEYATASSLTIPENVSVIYEGAFYEMENLTTINYNAIDASASNLTNSNYIFYYAGAQNGVTINIGANVKVLPNYIFTPTSNTTQSDARIIAINFATNGALETIGTGAISGYFTTLSIPSTVTSIAQYALYRCSALTSLTIPFVGANASQTTIGGSAQLGYIFNSNGGSYFTKTNQNYLTSYIPNSLTSVTVLGGNVLGYAFGNCAKITTLNITTSSSSIGDYTYAYMSALSSITINGNITSIGYAAFGACTSLTSFTIGSNVTSISQYAFVQCSALASVTFEDTSSSWTVGSSTITSDDLADAANAATLLTSTYYTVDWTKVEAE